MEQLQSLRGAGLQVLFAKDLYFREISDSVETDTGSTILVEGS
jgi:hypothetical protein